MGGAMIARGVHSGADFLHQILNILAPQSHLLETEAKDLGWNKGHDKHLAWELWLK
jgi:hypothetical protein